LHSEANISIDDTRGATTFANVRDQGNVLHSSATYRTFFAIPSGSRHVIKAEWLAYTPKPSGRVDGKKTSPQIILEVPLSEPAPRLTDKQKQDLNRLARGRYASCAAMLAGAAAGAASGFGAPVAIVFGVLAGANCTLAYLNDRAARDPVDPNFRAIAKPKTPAVPKVVAGNGLSAAAAAAVNKLLAVQAKQIGLARAIVTAFDRSQGAHVKKQTAWEKKQVQAAGRYAAQLATLMLTEAKLRPGVRAALPSIPPVSFEQAFAVGEPFARGTLPSELGSLLAKLDAKKAEQQEIRAQIAVIDPGLYDGDVRATIADPLQLTYLRQAAAYLKAFAKSAARDPLGTGP
jgi:hypothetical protein